MSTLILKILSCDGEGCPRICQATGQDTFHELRKAAKKEGWHVSASENLDYCPECYEKRRRRDEPGSGAEPDAGEDGSSGGLNGVS